MGKKLAALCMIAVTAGIFLVPKLYYEHIDTRLNENRLDYRYNVYIDNDLEFSEKKDILLNRECLIDMENPDYASARRIEQNINEMLQKIYFEEQYFKDEMENIDIEGTISEGICFKLTYVDDELIKILRIGTCIFVSDTFKGFAIYDADTYEVYIAYINIGSQDYWEGFYNSEGFNSIFEAEEIVNSKTIRSILEKTSLEKEYVYIEGYMEDEEMNLLDLFWICLKNEESAGIRENLSEEIN